jgi:hypothetical protein
MRDKAPSTPAAAVSTGDTKAPKNKEALLDDTPLKSTSLK